MKFILHCGWYEQLDLSQADWPEYQLKSHPDKLQNRLNKLIEEFQKQEKDVIVASNSEVFFYALRVAIRESVISHEDVEFHFHERGLNKSAPNIQILKCDSDGRFDYWPAGFFDKSETLLSKLLSRKKND